MKLPKRKSKHKTKWVRLKTPRKVRGITYTHYYYHFNGYELWSNESPRTLFMMSFPDGEI